MTAHIDAAEATLDRFLADPAGGMALQTYRAGVKEGRYGETGAVIGQQHWRDSWPLEQVACFAVVYSEICSGKVAQVQISAAGVPGEDADRTGNQALVADLPGPFTAEVSVNQNCADQDGVLRWSEPILMEVSTGVGIIGPDGGTRAETISREIPPGWAPLEIGTTFASNTLMHLRKERAVARWAYGQDRIRLLVAVGEPWQVLAGM
jgi:hypothetical protein